MRRPLRIAYFTHYADLYGANRSLLDLVRELKRIGAVEPFIIAARQGPLQETLNKEGIANCIIPFNMAMARRVYMGRPYHRIIQWWAYRSQQKARTQQDAALIPEIIDRIREWDIDLLHINSSVIGLGTELKERLGLPLVWHIRELPFSHYGLTPDIGVRGYFHRLSAADAVIGISKAVEKDLPPALVRSSRYSRIANGILGSGIRTTGSRTSGPFTFAVVGWIHQGKGQVEALEAFAAARSVDPAARMIIAGSGDPSKLKAIIDREKLKDHVELPGFIGDTSHLYERTNCLISCSRHEALGRAMIEAMSYGIPVIGHRSGGTIELIEEGSNGLLFSDRNELVHHMRSLLADRRKAERMGEEAQRSLGDRFSIEARAKDVLRVYEKLFSDQRNN